MSDDDQIWLDALAGRVSATTATTREAQVLRAAIRSASANTAPQNVFATRDTGREAALIARARREGVIPPAKPRHRTSWQLPIAASVLIVVGAGVVVQLTSPPPPVLRSDETGVVRLEAADPAALKQTILAELRAAGASATGYEALDVYGIDAELALPLSTGVRRVLDAHRIPEPPDGVLRIEIRSSE